MARILIFEDEADIAELYRMELEDRGHQVLGIHADPNDVLKSPNGTAPRPTPEVIVLDERLGSLSGMTFLARFRRAFPTVRIIMVSADPDALECGPDQGVDSVARKPVLLKRLVDDIEALLPGVS